MRYLCKGTQSAERFDLILGLTDITSPYIKGALYDFLVRGMGKKAACILNGVNAPNFSPALKAMEVKAEVIEKVKEHDARVR